MNQTPFPPDQAFQPAGAEAAVDIPLGGRKRPVLALAILAANVVVFLLMTLSGVSPIHPRLDHLLDWGATFGPYVLAGHWWRLFTSMFVHIGIIHLALNMQCLLRLGSLAERLFGRWAFLALYVLSGLGGAIASLWWDPNVVAAGASGAIFGLAGGLLILLWRGRLQLPRSVVQATLASTLLFVAYNLFYGLTQSGIDNAAHLGGLATGAVIGALLVRPLASADTRALLSPLLLAACLVLALVVGTFLIKGSDPTNEIIRAEELLDEGQIDEAITAIEGVLEKDPDLPEAHLVLGNACLQKELLEEAISSYSQAILLDENYTEAYFNRGLAYALMMQLNEALADFDRAIELGGDDGGAYYLRGLVYGDLGKTEMAIADLERALSLGLEPDSEEYAESILQQLR